MKLLVINLPAVNQSVACGFNENVTQEIVCYVVNAHETDMHSIPTNPGEQYRVPFSEVIGANLVIALREMIIRGQGS